MLSILLGVGSNGFIFSQVITNGASLQLGDSMAAYVLAKILSWKYNIPFYFTPFAHADLFAFYEKETLYERSGFEEVIRATEDDIVKNMHKENILFYTDLRTQVDYIDPLLINKLKALVQPSILPPVNTIPNNITTVAVHIRKGNGGGEYYDGEPTSLQEFDFNRNKVEYLYDYFNYPFDWEEYRRNITRSSPSNPANHIVDEIWQTKFPPNQFYIDQIKKLYVDLGKKPLYIQIFTDDKDPILLLQTIQKMVNNSSITFYYDDNRTSSSSDRIIQDLYNMARFDVFLRSQSYFARTAELMGNHRMVIYPLKARWESKKLIMSTVVIKKQ